MRNSNLIQRASSKKSSENLMTECIKILQSQNFQVISKWLQDNKMNSYQLRTDKATKIITVSNHILQKMLIQKYPRQNEFLHCVLQHFKKDERKCYEFARLVKHFSQWDYQFGFFYQIAQDEQQNDINLYLRCRDIIVQSDYNKGKKQLLSGISLELEDWANIARIVFKNLEEEDIVNLYSKVVKEHFIQVKKSQSQRLNGAQFFKICQIISLYTKENGKRSPKDQNISLQNSKMQRNSHDHQTSDRLVRLFDESMLNNLRSQDRELIRVLSYKDKNIARMLQEKHTKMVHLIGQQVNQLRQSINHQKERYVQVLQEKSSLQKITQKIKEAALNFIVTPNQAKQFQLLQILDLYNRKYNPRAVDVQKTSQIINNRRLIQIIERQQMQK